MSALPSCPGQSSRPPFADQILDLEATKSDATARLEQPGDIRPALERAQKKVDEGMVALVNVKTDYRARATTVQFSSRMT